MKITVGVLLQDDLYEAVMDEVDRRQTTVSSTIRQLLQEHLGLPVEAGSQNRLMAALVERKIKAGDS
jgi:hypothetical protein